MTTRERPILFSGAMVRAILDGKKTQTRRVLNPQPGPEVVALRHTATVKRTGKAQYTAYNVEGGVAYAFPAAHSVRAEIDCPYGQPGDRLWVRESFQPLFADGFDHGDERLDYKTGAGYRVIYPATDGVVEWHHEDDGVVTRVTPSIYMPRWACRLVLEVTDVRVERLQDISGEDSLAEGIEIPRCACDACFMSSAPCTADSSEAVQAFRALWDSINAKRGFGWDTNPWVWVVSFRRLDGDALRGAA